MSLSFTVEEYNSVKKNVNDTLQYLTYNTAISIMCSSGIYQLSDLRFRMYMNHHFASIINDSTTGYIPIISGFVNGITPVSTSLVQDIWKSDTRPCNIINNKFCQEDTVYFTTSMTLTTGSVISDGIVSYTGKWNNANLIGRFNDVSNSYSKQGNITSNPVNILFEQRDNTKTKSIKTISQENNVITVVTTDNHEYTSGMGVTITGIPNTVGVKYNGTYKITVIDEKTFICITNSVTTALSYTNIGSIEVWNVLSGVAPSLAIGVNYNTLPETLPIDHTLSTFLLYPEKDTLISSINNESIDIDYGNSMKSIIEYSDSIISKAIFKFFVSKVNNISSTFYSEFNVFNENTGSDFHNVLSIYQLSSDTWNENDEWDVISPLISTNKIAEYTCDNKMPLVENGVFTKFDIDTLYISSWLNGTSVSDITFQKSNNNNVIFSTVTRETSDITLKQLKPYLIITGTPESITSKSQPTFTANKYTGYVGDTIRLSIISGDINSDLTKNKVSFNGVIANIITQDSNDTWIDVLIPYAASTGDLSILNLDISGNANSVDFEVLYKDISFNKNEQVQLRESRQLIKSQTGMDGAILPAMYNKDFSYNYFVQLNDENTMVQNIYTLLLTRRGSRLMNPNYGIGIESYVFHLMDDNTPVQEALLNEINDAIRIYESRVTLIKDQSYIIWDEGNNSLKIILSIIIPSGSVKKVGVTLSNIRQDS